MPTTVPTMILGDGWSIPRIGFGTAGVKSAAAMATALREGVRLFDTAVMYQNEARIKSAIAATNVPRKEMYLLSKAWPFRADGHTNKSRAFDAPAKDVATLTAEVEAHIEAMGVGYLDLLLLHWPTHAICEQWTALIKLKRQGRVRSIGLSNAYVRDLDLLRQCQLEPPVLIQQDVGPVKSDRRMTFDAEELIKACWMRGVALMSYSQVSSMLRDARSRRLAQEAKVSVAHLALRYGLQRGFALIFSSRSGDHVRDNLRVFDVELDAATIANLACWRGEPRCDEVFGACFNVRGRVDSGCCSLGSGGAGTVPCAVGVNHSHDV